MQPIELVYSINGTALERVDEIKDLRVIRDGNHRECWVLLSVFQEIFVTRILIKLYTLHS
jgi:SH3-like domain-containing protein